MLRHIPLRIIKNDLKSYNMYNIPLPIHPATNQTAMLNSSFAELGPPHPQLVDLFLLCHTLLCEWTDPDGLTGSWVAGFFKAVTSLASATARYEARAKFDNTKKNKFCHCRNGRRTPCNKYSLYNHKTSIFQFSKFFEDRQTDQQTKSPIKTTTRRLKI